MGLGTFAGISCVSRKSGANILLRIFSIMLVAAALSGWLSVGLAQAQSYQFNRIEVEGNQRIQTGTIATYAGIERGRTISAGELNDAYQRILNSGLFESVDLIPQGSTLLVRVVENPSINRINFEGNRRIKDEALELVKHHMEKPFNDHENLCDVDLNVDGDYAKTWFDAK